MRREPGKRRDSQRKVAKVQECGCSDLFVVVVGSEWGVFFYRGERERERAACVERRLHGRLALN
jgi:hypothetical protein